MIFALAFASALSVAPAFATRTHRAATSGHSSKTSKKKGAAHQTHGQRQIDPERAKQIQSALIREHYLSGTPSGEWDAESQAAMAKYQADQGWQTKLTPDSRALIKLGLGPSQDSGKLQPANQAALPTMGSPAQSFSPSNSLAESHNIAQ